MRINYRENLLKTFKKAPFPAIMTIISFLLFIGVYWFLTRRTIEPYDIMGLIFAVPFLIFAMVTFSTAKGNLGKFSSSIITGLLIIILGFLFFTGLVYIIIDASTTLTTDIDKYERVLRITGHPNDHLTKYFPDKIPDDAQGIGFSYNPAFLQGGERFVLKYSTDNYSINKYIDELSQIAKWIGKLDDSQAMENGLYSYAFEFLGYRDLPEDFTIYLISSKPYKPNNWNHGEFSAVAISQKRNEIIFLVEDW